MMSPSRAGHPAVAAILSLCLAFAAFSASASPAGAIGLPDAPSGLSRMLAAYAPTVSVRGIATFEAVPSSAQVAALEGLGLVVQPMKHVRLALVAGTVSQMQAAVLAGAASDIYPDEAIQLFDTASTDAMGTATLRASGLTGQGVTVAVVDSGCDASHPDLADHVAHNVKLYSAEYANVPPDSSNTIVVPVEMGPYQNSDLGSGHGTHVAGIIAADSTSVADGSRYGVAPDAELVCYSIGEVLFTTAVVTAYDHLLDQPDLWGVDVINNSWGNSFRMFDPRDPVHVVTKAVTDAGAIVVFAAGNSGYEDVEMSLNPFSSAPWVISVAATSARTAWRWTTPRAGASVPVATAYSPATGSASTTPMSPRPGSTSAPPATRPGQQSDRARPARTPSPPGRAWPHRTSPEQWQSCCRPTRT
jgi:serine protease AprX